MTTWSRRHASGEPISVFNGRARVSLLRSELPDSLLRAPKLLSQWSRQGGGGHKRVGLEWG